MAEFHNICLIRIDSLNIEEIRHPRHCFPPLPLKYAQILLEQENNYHVKLFDCWTEQISMNELLKFILSWPVHIVVIYIDTFTSDSGINFASMIKKHNDIFIVGVGQDATSRPQEYIALSSIFDVILRGEFEEELLSLIKKLNSSNKSEVKEYYRQKSSELFLVPFLDNLPILRWKKEELQKYRFIYPLQVNNKILCGYILSMRGCPHECIFCSPIIRKSYGNRIRLRSASKIVDEIEELQKIGVNVISFEDDDFTLSREYVISVCQEIKRRSVNIKWVANARIDEVDSSLLRIMKDAGCSLLLFGVESGSSRIIEILKKTSLNIDWIQKAKDVFKKSRRIGISTCALFIIGCPTETKDEVEMTRKLIYELKPDMIKVHFFTLYPGSMAYAQFNNSINRSQVSKMHHYLSPLVNISNINTVELRKTQIRFYRRFLLNPQLIFRHLCNYAGFHIFNWRTSYLLFKKCLNFLFLKNKLEIKYES